MTVDDRVGSREFLQPLKRAGVPARQHRLKFADFAFTGRGPHGPVRIGIERKTTSEVINATIGDRRFARKQLPGLLNTYDYVYLVVEGYVRIDYRTGVLMVGKHREAGFTVKRHLFRTFKGWQNTIAIKGRVIVEPTTGFEHTVHLLHTLYWWWQDSYASHKSAYAVEETEPDTAILDERTLKRQVAAQLPYVGWERSTKVSKHFPTLAAMMLATEEDWMQALGVKKGRTMARGLVEACQGKRSDDQAAKH